MPNISFNHPSQFLENFFNQGLAKRDSEVYQSTMKELNRQKNQIELIASENIVSRAVMEAQGGVMTNKYAEGYSGKRYYGGCEFIDLAEDLAIKRAKQLFNCNYVNVQPHSGAQANGAVLLALVKPGETILGMSLESGGHLTHGAPPALSGKWFNSVQYGVRKDTHLINFDEVKSLARKNRPKLIICGGSAYPRIIDFIQFRKIANDVGAYLMVDMAHFAGLVASGFHPSPIPYADITTSTTHKTLRGPRGGIILTNNQNLSKKINSAVFPGLQGGPLMHVIAAKAVAFGEALTPEFKIYSKQVIENANVLAETLIENGFDIVSGGSDTHMLLVDLRSKGVTGRDAEQCLERVGITCNKNSIPFDPEKPMITSGIRLGTPAGTTRGFGISEFKQIGKIISNVLNNLQTFSENNKILETKTRRDVASLCNKFPIYSMN